MRSFLAALWLLGVVALGSQGTDGLGNMGTGMVSVVLRDFQPAVVEVRQSPLHIDGHAATADMRSCMLDSRPPAFTPGVPWLKAGGSMHQTVQPVGKSFRISSHKWAGEKGA
ncbi:MAG: hypothetical protein HY519_02560 [Candidatus Aenigmarchaeota archaeon]|nr:hypothetical protein [Candidatus Aenigmarchaeota archaeon]